MALILVMYKIKAVQIAADLYKQMSVEKRSRWVKSVFGVFHISPTYPPRERFAESPRASEFCVTLYTSANHRVSPIDSNVKFFISKMENRDGLIRAAIHITLSIGDAPAGFRMTLVLVD